MSPTTKGLLTGLGLAAIFGIAIALAIMTFGGAAFLAVPVLGFLVGYFGIATATGTALALGAATIGGIVFGGLAVLFGTLGLVLGSMVSKNPTEVKALNSYLKLAFSEYNDINISVTYFGEASKGYAIRIEAANDTDDDDMDSAIKCALDAISQICSIGDHVVYNIRRSDTGTNVIRYIELSTTTSVKIDNGLRYLVPKKEHVLVPERTLPPSGSGTGEKTKELDDSEEKVAAGPHDLLVTRNTL